MEICKKKKRAGRAHLPECLSSAQAFLAELDRVQINIESLFTGKYVCVEMLGKKMLKESGLKANSSEWTDFPSSSHRTKSRHWGLCVKIYLQLINRVCVTAVKWARSVYLCWLFNRWAQTHQHLSVTKTHKSWSSDHFNTNYGVIVGLCAFF